MEPKDERRSWRNLFRKRGPVRLPSLPGFFRRRRSIKSKDEGTGTLPPKPRHFASGVADVMLFQRERTGFPDEMVGYGMEAVSEVEQLLPPPQDGRRGRCPVCTLPLPCGIAHPPKEKKGFFGRSAPQKSKKFKGGAAPASKPRPRTRARSDGTSEDDDISESEDETGTATPGTRGRPKQQTRKHARKKTNVPQHETSGESDSSDTEYNSDAEKEEGTVKEGKEIVGRDHITASQLARIKRAWGIYDTGKVGRIDKDQVMGVMRELGQPCKSVAELEEFYEWADTDDVGRILLDEFINLMVVKVGFRSAVGVHFMIDSLKGFEMPSIAKRMQLHGHTSPINEKDLAKPVKKSSTLTSRKPNRKPVKGSKAIPPSITVRIAGGGAGFAAAETLLHVKPKVPRPKQKKTAGFKRRRSWGKISDQGDIDKSWGDHERNGEVRHGMRGSIAYNAEKGIMHKYEHKDLFFECPTPCHRHIEIEIIGDMKISRMDGRAVRDVVGSCRLDISHLRLLAGEHSKMIITNIYEPLRRHSDGRGIRIEGDDNVTDSQRRADVGTQNSGKDPPTKRGTEVVDEDIFLAPSHRVIGHLMLHMAPGLQEQSRSIEQDDDDKEIPWDLKPTDESSDAYIYDECILVLDKLVQEHEADKTGTRDSTGPCQVDLIWEKLDWQNLGVTSLGKVEAFIANDLSAMVDREILRTVYMLISNDLQTDVGREVSRRSWVRVKDFLDILCCQLIFKRIFAALEDVPNSPLAWDEPPPLIEIRVDKRQFAYLLKCCAMPMSQGELDSLWHQSSPDDTNTIVLVSGCYLATRKRFRPKRYGKGLNNTGTYHTSADYRAKMRLMQKRQRQKSALLKAKRETGITMDDWDGDSTRSAGDRSARGQRNGSHSIGSGRSARTLVLPNATTSRRGPGHGSHTDTRGDRGNNTKGRKR